MDLSKIRCLTIKYPNLSTVIACSVEASFPKSLLNVGEIPAKETFVAIWDTGAMGSAITELAAKKLNLAATGVKKVSGLGGTIIKNTYLIDLLLLPAKIEIKDLPVTELDNPVDENGNKREDFGLLIGMDIIAMGDFCITNYEGKTTMTFRIPSCIKTDYVHDWKVQSDIQNKISRNPKKR